MHSCRVRKVRKVGIKPAVHLVCGLHLCLLIAIATRLVGVEQRAPYGLLFAALLSLPILAPLLWAELLKRGEPHRGEGSVIEPASAMGQVGLLTAGPGVFWILVDVFVLQAISTPAEMAFVRQLPTNVLIGISSIQCYLYFPHLAGRYRGNIYAALGVALNSACAFVLSVVNVASVLRDSQSLTRILLSPGWILVQAVLIVPPTILLLGLEAYTKHREIK